MSKVLFLDIDGVLNCNEWYEKRARPKDCRWAELNPDAMALFDEIIERTNCAVVLSSVWRLSDTYIEDLEREGLNTNAFIGRTPSMHRPPDTGVEYMERGKEIAAWLEQHPEVTRYAILDDDSDFLPEQPLFRTSWETGLTREIAEKVINHLNQ